MKADRLIHTLQNETTLLWYSLRMLVGRNLLAVGIISIVAIGAVFSYPVSLLDTKWAILLMQMEMFSPLLGIVIFSDLIAGDVQARRATLLMSSRYGIVPVVIRKLIHGLIITSATYLINLLVLRLFYTSFNIFSAFAIVLPGALYFGMIGLLGATFTSHALAGYAAGTSALILSMVVKQAMPLVPTAYQLKSKLASATLFAEHNWLFAKITFVFLAGVLAVLVIVMAKKRSYKVHIIIASVLILTGTYFITHKIWSRKSGPDLYFSEPGKQLDVIQKDDELIVRTAAVSVWGRGKNKTNEETLLTDTIYESDNTRWIKQRQVEYDPAKEYDLVHLDIDADVDPATGLIDAKARAEIKVLAENLSKVYIRIGWEFQVKQLNVEGAQVMFSRYGDLIEIPLAQPIGKGQTIELHIEYGGNLRLPSARQRSERYDKNILFVNSRWYPFVKSWYHEGMRDMCTYEAKITVPQGWHVGSGQLIETKGTGQTWHFGTNTPCDRIGLVVTRFRKHQAKVGDILVTVFGHSISDQYMRRIAERACGTLRYYEQAFGKYPHRSLSIVEYDYMNAGGVAVPSIVLMNTKRCRPELESEMLNGYVPHEIAHQWFSSGLPTWIAEAAAVYSNYLYLAQGSDSQSKLAGFHKSLNDMFESNKDYPITLIDSTGVIPYIKGGYLLMMLTSVNKQRTVDSLGTFITDQLTRQLVDKSVIAERFIEAMNKAGGDELTSFVSDWIYTIKKFDPAVTEFTQFKTADGFSVKGSLAHYEEIRFPVPFRISFEDGTSFETTWDGSSEDQTFEWTFDKPVRSIILDPDNVLLDWDRSNNFRSVSAFVAGKTKFPRQLTQAKSHMANWTTYTVADGLLNNNVRCLAVDAEDRLIVGFHLYSKKSGTVVQCFDSKWTQLDSLSEPSGPVYAVAVQSDGAIWTGGSGRLRRINQNGTDIFILSQIRDYRTYSIGKGIFEPNPEANLNITGYVIYDLTIDNKGNLWIATDNGISIIDASGKVIEYFNTNDGLPGNEVLCMAWHGSGTLWIGTDKGPASYENNQWTTYPECPTDIILALAIGPDDNISFGTYRYGIITYDQNNFRRYDNSNSRLPHNMVTALVYDEQNRLWAGTSQGLLCIDKGSQHIYTSKNSGLLSNHITDLLADGKSIWIATDAGITKYEK